MIGVALVPGRETTDKELVTHIQRLLRDHRDAGDEGRAGGECGAGGAPARTQATVLPPVRHG